MPNETVIDLRLVLEDVRKTANSIKDIYLIPYNDTEIEGIIPAKINNDEVDIVCKYLQSVSEKLRLGEWIVVVEYILNNVQLYSCGGASLESLLKKLNIPVKQNEGDSDNGDTKS